MQTLKEFRAKNLPEYADLSETDKIMTEAIKLALRKYIVATFSMKVKPILLLYALETIAKDCRKIAEDLAIEFVGENN